MSTILELAQKVARRLPLDLTISSLVGNSEPFIAQLLETLEEEGEELMSCHEWSRLIKEWEFGIDADPHLEALPSDFDRLAMNADFWRSGSDITPLTGPVANDSWHYIVTISGTFPGYWRPYSTGYQITGVATDESVDVEYISKNFVLDVGGSTEKATFTNDGDTVLLPDRLFILGARWRWKQARGLEYGEDMATYEIQKEVEISKDRSARPVRTRRNHRGMEDISKYSWPGVVTETS